MPDNPPSYEVLQHRALPSALAADHSYLRQVEVAALPDGAEGILEFVNEGNQILHPPVPHVCTPAGLALLDAKLGYSHSAPPRERKRGESERERERA